MQRPGIWFQGLATIRFQVLRPMNSLLAFSLSNWFSESLYDLVHYFDHLNGTEWAIISGSAVVFGFACLKGTSLRA